MPDDLTQYYAARADEYETIYEIPAAQDDYEQLTDRLQTQFIDREVIDVACGTGSLTVTILAHRHDSFSSEQVLGEFSTRSLPTQDEDQLAQIAA